MPSSPGRAGAVLIALVLLLCALPVAPATGAEAVSTGQTEWRLVRLVNEARSRAGAPPLRVDVRLVASARTWSRQMAKAGRLSHDGDLRSRLPREVSIYAENVAVVGSEGDVARALHDLLMSSPSHRQNVLDPRFTDLGIGIASAGGRTYVTQRLTRGAPAKVSRAVAALADSAAKTFRDGAQHAVLVRDDVFADALAAGPLAGPHGPLLLTPPGPVAHPAVRAALEGVLPKGRTVWIVGGEQAVHGGVESELRAAGWDVRRLFGSTRFGTAEQVAKALAAREGRPDRVLIATGYDWPDAVAGGAYGARTAQPVLLTLPDAVPGETRRALAELRPRAISVLGGSGAVAGSVVQTLGAKRVAGSTRIGTAAETARVLWGYRDTRARSWIAAPAYGDDAWTWALGAAPLAARSGAAVLLVGLKLSRELVDYIGALGYAGSATAELTVVGPVPARAADDLRALLR